MHLANGTRLAQYEIRGELGSGGMGRVFRAADLRLKRDVALKVISGASLAEREAIRRFQIEARACSALNHPHIINIFDSGEENGIAYIAMELVGGSTLDQWLKQQRPRLDQIIGLFVQVADAVGAAHEAGIVHRDLKPANILVTKEGYAKVLDFGLAKIQSPIAGASALQTAAGVLLGTPAYMSPEQAAGSPADERSDMFSLGTVLYEATTGVRAFKGETFADILHAIVHDEPPRISDAIPHLPPELAWIAEKAMSKRPEDRYATARELARDLKRLGGLIASRARSDDAPTLVMADRRSSRMRPGIVAATVAVAAIAAAATWLMIGPRFETSPQTSIRADAVTRQLTALGGSETSGAISPDGRYFAYVSARDGVEEISVRQISGGDPVQITRDGRQKDDLVFSDRGDTIYFTRFDDSGPTICRVPALGGAVQSLVGGARWPSPRGDMLAFVRVRAQSELPGVSTRTIEIANADGSSPVRLYTALGIDRIDLSPDKTMIAFSEGSLFEGRNLQIVGTTPGAKKRQITRFDRGWILGQTWLPDGKHLLASRTYDSFLLGTTSDLVVISVETGKARRISQNLNSRFVEPTISSDGRRVVVTRETFEREVWKVPITGTPDENGDAAELLVGRDGDPFWIHAVAGRNEIVFNSSVTGNRNLWLMRMNGREPSRQLTFAQDDDITHSSLSPDGTKIAYSVAKAGDAQIHVAEANGSNARLLTSGPGYRYWPIWSPDGNSIVFSKQIGGVGDVVRVPLEGGAEQSVGGRQGFFRGDWSPDGKTIVGLRGNLPGIFLMDLTSRTYRRLAAGETWTWSLPVWNASGTKIAALRRENALSDAVWILDPATGEAKKVATFRGQFHMIFRTPFTADEKAVIVNRAETVSHIVLLENF